MAGNTNSLEGMLGIDPVDEPMYMENSVRPRVDRQLEDAKKDAANDGKEEKDRLYQEFKMRQYEEKISKLQSKLHQHRMLKVLKDDPVV